MSESVPAPSESSPQDHSAFDDLPLLIAVSRAAKLIGISRATAYRLTASGELPTKRLGGRIYVVTAELRARVEAA